MRNYSLNGFTNVWVLALSNALAASMMTLMILVGSLVGKELTADPKWATLPIALTVCGTALGIWPATRCMQSVGRKRGLWLFFGLGALACWLASAALTDKNFTLFCLASLLFGIANAALQQTRFAAMESVAPESAPSAASIIMLGGIVAAVVGPELAVLGAHLTPVDYQGSFALAALALLCAALLLSFYQPAPISSIAQKSIPRPFLSIIQNRSFCLAVLSGAVAYGVMSFVMTGTPISMHHIYGHSLVETKYVIQSHIVAMFVPSLIAPFLFKRLGIKGMMVAGLACYCTTIAVGYSDVSVNGFWLQLVLLGIGWNFLFVAGTALLPSTYEAGDNFKAQTINDITVFTLQCFASLSAGWALGLITWQAILLICVGPILLMTVLLTVEYRAQAIAQR